MIAFIIVRTLNAKGGNTTEESKPKCPKCKSEFIRINANNNNSVIRCMDCFWEQYYLAIRRNE